MEIFPAGLVDNQIEIFGHEFKASCLVDGNTLSFNDFPERLIEALQKNYNDHPTAKKALIDWGISEDEHLERFTFCMYAGFDNIADFTVQQELTNPEYHNHCGSRGKCSYEGKCCSGLNVKYGRLTPREMQIASLIGKCYADKLICFELSIAQDTLRNHKNSIERKAGVYGKIGIAVMAHKYNLV